ncbi:MAG: hypothetical protein AAF551_01080 [Bacteroidota bacterium]
MKYMGLLLMVFFLPLSCSTQQDCCAQVAGNDTLFEFSLVNENQEDLFDGVTQNSYDPKTIKLYNLIDGKETLIHNPNSDSPNGYLIFERDELHRIRPFFDESNLTSKGIVEWSPTNRDTLSLTMVQQSERVKRLVMIKYNGETVWDETVSTNINDRYFQIVK